MTTQSRTSGYTPVPSAPPAGAPAVASTDGPLDALQAILDKYEVTIAEVNDLAVLQDYEIVFVADDSGSMQMSSVPASERTLGQRATTRWDELCNTVRMVAEVACCLDADGVDVFFLNRPPVLNVASVDDPRFVSAMAQPPRGGTPLTEVVRNVIHEKSGCEKPVLVLIATDGEPNGGPQPFKRVLTDALARRTTATSFRFQILACTEDDDAVEWLNDFDDRTKGVDVTDDYYTERAQVLKAGRVTQFKRSDWVVKALLGAVIDKYDNLDATMVNNQCVCAIL